MMENNLQRISTCRNFEIQKFKPVRYLFFFKNLDFTLNFRFV